MGGPGAWLALLLAAAASLLAAEGEFFCDSFGSLLCDHQTDACVASDFGCPDGYVFMENATACNCCGGCVKTVKVGCEIGKIPCTYGYECVTNDEGEDEKYFCRRGECTKEKQMLTTLSPNGAWTPTCNADGSYAPVQCKGARGNDGRCFCWSPDGERIYGFAPWNQDSEHMDCACSLKSWRMAKEIPSRAHEAPRCTEDGSYDTLQCSAGVCWCANRRTGQPVGRVVPQAAISMLLCYNMDDVGVQYRRVCDSILDTVSEMERVFLAHGGNKYGLPEASCDLDGGYGPVQTRKSEMETYCSRKDKNIIPSYYQDSDPNRKINCKCARDVDYYEEERPCYSNGNYKTRRNEGGVVNCYDSDGFFSYILEDTSQDCPDELH